MACKALIMESGYLQKVSTCPAAFQQGINIILIDESSSISQSQRLTSSQINCPSPLNFISPPILFPIELKEFRSVETSLEVNVPFHLKPPFLPHIPPLLGIIGRTLQHKINRAQVEPTRITSVVHERLPNTFLVRESKHDAALPARLSRRIYIPLAKHISIQPLSTYPKQTFCNL
jgi:hypothetical protein